jgi:lysophospholipase L1-like esterase
MRNTWTAKLAIVLAGLAYCGSSARDGPAAEPLRVLAAGDSITYGAEGHYYGYRGFLADLAAAAGLQMLLVGGETENLGVGEGHEGHPGWRSDEVLSFLPAWLDRSRPDVVLLHVGTNDIFQGRPVQHAAASIEAILDLMAGTRPDCWTVVATSGPFRSPKDAQARELTAEITRIVSGRAGRGQKVVLADSRAALAASPAGLPALLVDSAHPSDLGYYLMSKTFFEAIRSIRRPA